MTKKIELMIYEGDKEELKTFHQPSELKEKRLV